MKASVSWKVLEHQLQTKPEYVTLLERYCKEFAENRKKLVANSIAQTVPELVTNSGNKVSLGEGNVEKIKTNLAIENRYQNYEVDKKKLGIFAVDFDSIMKLDNLPSNLFSSFSEKLNFDGLRQYSFPASNRLKNVSQDTVDFMDSILTEFTHIKNYAVPMDGSQIIYVFANCDKYVPRLDIETPAELWPVKEIRYIDCGHIVGVLKYQKVFRDAIRDALSIL